VHRLASSFEAVYGMAADDRTFVVTGKRLHGADAGTVWYLLRIGRASARYFLTPAQRCRTWPGRTHCLAP
jgi:hypothetical protein